jgi:dihydrofolate reductase
MAIHSNLNLIYARARNGVIGIENRLPWHLPEDLAHFKRTTLGCPVIMGRLTWESLPPAFRPLPGRQNWVLTRQVGWLAEGATTAPSLAYALSQLPLDQPLWVIGGSAVYAHALPMAARAVVTEIDQEFAGDAYAPELGPQWREVARERHTSTSGLGYSFVTYEQVQEPIQKQSQETSHVQ